jgi:hypothetical protein
MTRGERHGVEGAHLWVVRKLECEESSRPQRKVLGANELERISIENRVGIMRGRIRDGMTGIRRGS